MVGSSGTRYRGIVALAVGYWLWSLVLGGLSPPGKRRCSPARGYYIRSVLPGGRPTQASGNVHPPEGSTFDPYSLSILLCSCLVVSGAWRYGSARWRSCLSLWALVLASVKGCLLWSCYFACSCFWDVGVLAFWVLAFLLLGCWHCLLLGCWRSLLLGCWRSLLLGCWRFLLWSCYFASSCFWVVGVRRFCFSIIASTLSDALEENATTSSSLSCIVIV